MVEKSLLFVIGILHLLRSYTHSTLGDLPDA